MSAETIYRKYEPAASPVPMKPNPSVPPANSHSILTVDEADFRPYPTNKRETILSICPPRPLTIFPAPTV
jgi:hypothetical protein